jgi:polar amino acid transport system substrate-binding protein
VTAAVDALRKDGTLARLEKQWLSDAVDAPVLK